MVRPQQRWQSALADLVASAPGSYSVAVCDAAGHSMYAYAENTMRSAASLIKVPLAMALVDAIASQSVALSLDTCMILHASQRVEGPGIIDAAAAGTMHTVRDLISHALRESDNTAANLLIGLLGMESVNTWLHQRGFETRLRRYFMDFEALAAGYDNTTTAREMCMLLQMVQQPCYAMVAENLRYAVGDGKLEAGLPLNVVLAHKVGDLAGVEHDVGIVWAPHGVYMLAVLGVELPDVAAARQTIAQISRLVWEGTKGEG